MWNTGKRAARKHRHISKGKGKQVTLPHDEEDYDGMGSWLDAEELDRIYSIAEHIDNMEAETTVKPERRPVKDRTECSTLIWSCNNEEVRRTKARKRPVSQGGNR